MLMAIFALAATAAGAAGPDQVLIAYEMKMGARQISGVSHELECSGLALGDERARVRLRVPIDSFDSGHPDFDSQVRRAIGADDHPFVQIEGIAQQGRLEGTLDLAGVARPIAARLQADRDGDRIVAAASLAIDLRDYGIAIEGVDPHVSIDAIVRIAARPDAVLAGGFNRPTN